MGEDPFTNLEHTVGEHERGLNDLSERIKDLKADIEIILQESGVLQQAKQALNIMETTRSQYSGRPAPAPELIEKYRAFLKRYPHLAGE